MADAADMADVADVTNAAGRALKARSARALKTGADSRRRLRQLLDEVLKLLDANVERFLLLLSALFVGHRSSFRQHSADDVRGREVRRLLARAADARGYGASSPTSAQTYHCLLPQVKVPFS
jgi:negative regulator of replication initiation